MRLKLARSQLEIVVTSKRAFAFFLVLGLLVVLVVLPTPHRGGYNKDWIEAVGGTYLVLLASVASLVFVFRFLSRTTLSPNARLGIALVVAIAPHLVVAGTEFFYYPGALGFEGDPLPTLQESVSVAVCFGFLVFGLWALAFVLPEMAVRETARANEAIRLRLLADHRELRARLAPHFLLNTLNAVAGLVGEDPGKARSVISALGDLLRASLYPTEEEHHAVSHELALLESYANILRARYGRRVEFAWEVSPEAKECNVPRLLIQPLVENAVLHGALKSRAASVVSVCAFVEDNETLVFLIENEGVFRPPIHERAANADSGGHGLLLVRRRLELLGDGATLTIGDDEGRTRAKVRLPLKRKSSTT